MATTDFKTLSREMRGRDGIRGSLLMLMIILFLATAVTWASLTEIDNVTRGEGEIVSSMQNQLVQASQAGILLQSYVSEGDAVSEGEILFEIDPVEAVGELARI
ncbi:MAG: biotin/lipoyl-binding protein, partial [Wenzhouxiangella sp.]|nr:biotin/lipoyl-binding protein [Wenzhouxiangella sp.]